MKVYLVGGTSYQVSKKEVVEQMRRAKLISTVNLLETFFEIYLEKPPVLVNNYNLMLDSGAFSFLSSGKRVDWDKYISRYIDYINANDVKFFFELDIDKIIGYDRVKEIRRRLERETGKRPIPVWHKYLGKQEFIRMCDEYDYVAIGGIVSWEIMPTEYKYLPAFINEAHKRGTKIHGLGFTQTKWLPICHFDSVDSSAWTAGMRYGQIYTFDGRTIRYKKCPPGYRVKGREVALYNFKQWLLFADHAEKHL